jgi:hypothetical protein
VSSFEPSSPAVGEIGRHESALKNRFRQKRLVPPRPGQIVRDPSRRRHAQTHGRKAQRWSRLAKEVRWSWRCRGHWLHHLASRRRLLWSSSDSTNRFLRAVFNNIALVMAGTANEGGTAGAFQDGAWARGTAKNPRARQRPWPRPRCWLGPQAAGPSGRAEIAASRSFRDGEAPPGDCG